MRIRAYVYFCVVAILLFFITALMAILCIQHICPIDLRAKVIGKPICVKRQTAILNTGIDQILTDSQHIYVVHGGYGVVQVYDLQGEYQKSIAVYSHRNGRVRIAVDSGHLYICDKKYNVYIFTDGEFDSYFDSANAEPFLSNLSFDENSDAYSLKSGSIWHTDGSGSACIIIARPAWLSLYQNGLGDLIVLSFILILAGVLYYRTRDGSLS